MRSIICNTISVFILSVSMVYAQLVPDHVDFAGLHLYFTKSAKARIQADVDMIKKSPTYFQQKVDRANLYFPVIEKVFTEESFPTEFKYLALQESSLVSDAVSSSQAVGYWQFKKESAVEVGVRVDPFVDERMNIYASTKGASKYLKRNQGVLNNWVYTLLSYNLGLGGVRSFVKDEYVGAQTMEIDEDMHWYVFRFLAHKIAYEGAVGNAHHSQLYIVGYHESEKKSLAQIAKESSLSEETLIEYNKWCLKKEIPGNGDYMVVLPVPVIDKEQYIAKYEKGQQGTIVSPPIIKSNTSIVKSEPGLFIPIDEYKDWKNAPVWVSINRVRAVRVSANESIEDIILAGGISQAGFLRFNEIKASHQLEQDHYYYLQLKRTQAIVAFHTVEKGETLWSIAQHYGVTTNAIRSKNRMPKNEALKEGRVLWLQDKRPHDRPIEYKTILPVLLVPQLELKKDTVLVKSEPIVNMNIQSNVLLNPSLNIYHVVAPKETMFSLSRQYGVSSDSILAWNNLTTYALQSGQNLIVGKKVEQHVKHVVQQGETLYKISKLYNVSVDSLLQLNHKSDPSLKLGEELIIK